MNPSEQKIYEYQLIKILGAGSFALVYLAMNELTNELVAVKELKFQSQEELICIFNEVKFIQQITHPNVIRILDVFIFGNNLYLILEYCTNGNLEQFLKTQPGNRLTEKEAAPILIQLIDGLYSISQAKIVHRDLKLQNILLTSTFHIKICDFGLSKQLSLEQSLLQTFCGSPLTMAPEIQNGEAYNKKCDIWSLGIIIYQIIYGKPPFPLEGIMLNINQKDITYPENIPVSASLKALLNSMLQIDQSERIDFEKLKVHEWTTSQNFSLEDAFLMSETLISSKIISITEEQVLSQESISQINRIVDQLTQSFRSYHLGLIYSSLNFILVLDDAKERLLKVNFANFDKKIEQIDITLHSLKRVLFKNRLFLNFFFPKEKKLLVDVSQSLIKRKNCSLQQFCNELMALFKNSQSQIKQEARTILKSIAQLKLNFFDLEDAQINFDEDLLQPDQLSSLQTFFDRKLKEHFSFFTSVIFQQQDQKQQPLTNEWREIISQIDSF